MCDEVASLVVRPRGRLLCGNTPVGHLNSEGRFLGGFWVEDQKVEEATPHLFAWLVYYLISITC